MKGRVFSRYIRIPGLRAPWFQPLKEDKAFKYRTVINLGRLVAAQSPFLDKDENPPCKPVPQNVRSIPEP